MPDGIAPPSRMSLAIDRWAKDHPILLVYRRTETKKATNVIALMAQRKLSGIYFFFFVAFFFVAFFFVFFFAITDTSML
jgi:hypothetical protein